MAADQDHHSSPDLASQLAALIASMAPEEQQLALAAVQRYATHAPHGGPLTWLLGIHYTSVGAGYASCTVAVEHAHHNPAGIAHGALAYALLDSAMGAAFYHALERPLGCATLELKVNYVRPVVQGSMTASAELVERTTRFGILTGRVVDAEGNLVALAQGTFAIIQPK
jgi:acyl-CoA thioesterase